MPDQRSHRLIASPRARRLLTSRGLDGRTVHGSGPGGRILEADVLAAQTPAAQRLAGGGIQTSPARRMIAKATQESMATIPHIFLQAEVDASRLVALRAQVAPGIEATAGVKPTITDFLLRAISGALRLHPQASMVWRDGGLQGVAEAMVGLVVGLEDGLSIPVLAPATDLAGTAKLRREAVERARGGQLPQARPCASSLSNIGSGRTDAFTAIIPLGQSSILAVGRLAPRPWAVGDALCVRQTLRLTLSADHRVLDGQPASLYLASIVEALEDPERLL